MSWSDAREFVAQAVVCGVGCIPYVAAEVRVALAVVATGRGIVVAVFGGVDACLGVQQRLAGLRLVTH